MKLVYIGDYRLIARLGRGPSADTFLTVRRGVSDARELVVVKRFRDDFANLSPRRLQSARSALRLHHPHIVETFEVARAGERWFSASEYIEGQPLTRVLEAAARTGEGLALDDTLHIVDDVLAALEYAHALRDGDQVLGVAHRGVSPHDIMVTYRGEAKLLDFGVAQSDDPELGMIEGRLGYMAPEQAEGRPGDVRSDLFALGVVLWECLARRRAFPVERARELVGATLPPLAAERPELDPALHALCERALARHPDARYQRAADMRADLAALLAADGGKRAQLATHMHGWFENERQRVAQRVHELMGAEPTPASVSDRPTTFGLSLEPALVRSESPASSIPPPMPKPFVAKRNYWTIAAAGLCLLLGAAISFSFAARRPADEPTTAAKAAPLPAAARAVERDTLLRLCGSNTIGAELAPALVEAFFATKGATGAVRERDPKGEHMTIAATLAERSVGVEISAHGSATAFTGLADGSCDVGMASRPINDDEADKLRERFGGDLRSPGSEHVIALDGIAVIVHPDNPIRALNRGALHDVFSGRVDDWSALGGRAGKIRVLARDDNSGTFDTFKHLILGSHALVATAARYPGNEALADAVASDPSAIGFVGLAYVRAAKALAVSETGAAPMLPSRFTVATEGYLLSRRLYLYTLPKPRTSWITAFVSFALSRKAQEVAAENQFVDLGLVTHGEECDSRCSARYAATVAHAQRLSVDFRFRSGSGEPDSRASRDIERLSSFLADHQGSKLLLLGFSDAVGNPSSNVALSIERARSIDRELSLRGVRASVVTGFGADMPVAANESDTGRQRNRRVEAWIQP